MGLIINKPMPGLNFMELADRLDLSKTDEETRARLEQTPLLMGGPVDQHRGFVLHSADYGTDDDSLVIDSGFKLTATVDVLQDMAFGKGPMQTTLALGYAGWSPGQLENEMLHNGWLHCDADADLIFGDDVDEKYLRALRKIGVDPGMLSNEAGHA